jgi:hypothetical protein
VLEVETSDPAAKEDLPGPGADDGAHDAFGGAVRERAAPDHGGARTTSDKLIFNCTHSKEDPERATPSVCRGEAKVVEEVVAGARTVAVA